MNRFLLIMALFFSFAANATIGINLSLAYRRGIDKGLVLGSEHHSQERGLPGEKIIFITASGIKVAVYCNWINNKDVYGPSSDLLIDVYIYDSKTDSVLYKETGIKMSLWETKKFEYKKSQSELIELLITPEMIIVN